VEFSKQEPLTRLTLRIESEDKVEVVFKNKVFNDKELKELLKLLKPYFKRKNGAEKIEVKNATLELFDEGFALNNREFYYDEISDIETTLIDNHGTFLLDFKIFLKNGEIVDKRLNGGSDEYAKAIFAKLKHDGEILFGCDENKAIGVYIVLVLDIVTAVLIYFDKRFLLLGGVMLFISAYYFDYKMNASYKNELCKKVEELSKKEIYEKIDKNVK
jgi:hypothetical protein